MSVVKTKYAALAPRASHLSDVVVLAQAWKKAHTYIRRHSWYADTLELDCSAIDIDSRLSEWSAQLESNSYKPDPLRLVPAPKNAHWTFDRQISDGWGPRIAEGEARPVLRPLAHLGIREQSISTAVMLCLANCIETVQGEPTADVSEARQSNVYSYGNRLYCRWEALQDGTRVARFSWGSSDTYSRYFRDYRSFVDRPLTVARQEHIAGGSRRTVYIVKLDLTAFFDRIDIGLLIERLRKEFAAYKRKDPQSQEDDSDFWILAKKALSFAWDSRDLLSAALLRDEVLPTGLPQGMVGSGFFANAYLLGFDRTIGALSKNSEHVQGDLTFCVHDYCRYVDDLRLVVSIGNTNLAESEIAGAIAEWVQGYLDSSSPVRPGGDGRLTINLAKTELERSADAAGESGAAARMRSLQEQLSGPFDLNALHHVEAGLGGLLALAELGATRVSSPLEGKGAVQTLASVARPKLEVRDDTLTRFSAFRLTRSLRLRRSMTDLDATSDEGLAKDVLLHDFEVAARRLVAAWAVNPSLVQVLRYALDLFPSVELLSSVTDALGEKIRSPRDTFGQHVAYYVLGELFRAGATETGRTASNELDFAVGDIGGYRQKLGDLAEDVLVRDVAPWYVRQQAALLLASIGRGTNIPGGSELRLHNVLHEFLRGENQSRKVGIVNTIAVSIVGHQLLGDVEHYRTWFRRFAIGRARKDRSRALELLGQTNSYLFSALTSKKGDESTSKEVPKYLAKYDAARWSNGSSEMPSAHWISLAKVITHPSEPFRQENALLELARALGVLLSNNSVAPEALTPLSVELSATDWSRLNDPRQKVLTARVKLGRSETDPRYRTPAWCEETKAWMYAVGRLIRAAATGEFDFTARHWILRDVSGWYHGIHSTWQKRRMGMLHTSKAVAGAGGAVTPWISELLLHLLRWPGIHDGAGSIAEFNSIRTPADFVGLVEARQLSQKNVYGVSSDLPVYVYPVEWTLRNPKLLRVAIVQGLLPSTSDFDFELAKIGSPRNRAKHRNHTAALLNLAYKKVQALDTVFENRVKPSVDLVLLPEYCIHVSDQDLVRAFSDATGAMLFYGLSGATLGSTGGVINAARWLVPQRMGGRRSWIEVDQGKKHLTKDEIAFGVVSWRPYQVVVELRLSEGRGFRIGGAVCYDATDLALAADLKNISHMFVVAALNKDVRTFDSMVSALRYHMYQHVLVANTGEFGGSTAQAPYSKEHERLVAHVHGANQIAVSIFDVDIEHFGPLLLAAVPGIQPIGKTPPAGLAR